MVEYFVYDEAIERACYVLHVRAESGGQLGHFLDSILD